MKLVLLGPPGAGKGTQAVVLSNYYKITHISAGDLLRESVKNETEAGRLAKGYMDKGELVPDEIVTKIIIESISTHLVEGFILDGFPRNISQATDLERELQKLNTKLDTVLYFKTKESTSIERLTGRRICPECGLNYHIKNRPPKDDNICDTCGVQLIQRKDDTIETIKNRLTVYQHETKPLLNFYKKRKLLKEASGDLDVDTLFENLKILFSKERNL